MEKQDYNKLMNEKEIVSVTENTELKRGTLIGFKGLSSSGSITAAYPIWSKNGKEVQFVLGITESGRPIIDNDFIREENIFVNKEPIVVDVETNNPQTFHERLSSFF